MKSQIPSDTVNFRFQRIVAFISLILFAGKLLAWQITNSDAVFSDAMESIVNIIAAFMGLYSLHLAAKPKDHDHPYGHGKIEFITSGIEGALIIFAGLMIIIESADSMFQGNALKQLDHGIFIIAFTALINYFLGHLSIKKGKKENSAVLISSGKHLQSDTMTTIGVVGSLVLVYCTQINWLDALFALLFGGYIIIVGYRIIRKSLSGIMDETDTELVKRLADTLSQHRKTTWVDVHNVRIQQHGSKLHIDGHITLPYYLELRAAHEEMTEMIKLIAQNTDRQVEFNFHMDDCKAFSCEICENADCPVRKKKFVQNIPWNVQNITQPDKHRKES